MSFYTFATGSLTTARDRNRQAAVSRGQVARTVILCLAAAIVLLVMFHRQSHAAERAGQPGVRQMADTPLQASRPLAAP